MLEGIGRPVAAVQSKGVELLAASDALVIQIVNRVDGACAREPRASAQSGMEIDRQQRGMPVMRVHDFGRHTEDLASADDRAAEKCEALDAVVVAVRARCVDL